MKVLVGAWNPTDIAMISLFLYRNGIQPIYFSKNGLRDFLEYISDGKTNLWLIPEDFGCVDKLKPLCPDLEYEEYDGDVDAVILHHLITEAKTEDYFDAPLITFSACSESTFKRCRENNIPKRTWAFDPDQTADLFTPRFILPTLYGMSSIEFSCLVQNRRWGNKTAANLEGTRKDTWEEGCIGKVRKAIRKTNFYGSEVYLDGSEILRTLLKTDFLVSFRNTAGISWSLIEAMTCGTVPVYPQTAFRGGFCRYLDPSNSIAYDSLDDLETILDGVDVEKLGRAAMERVASLGTLDQCIKSVGKYFARLT